MNYHEVKAVCDEAAKKGLPGHVCFTWHYRPYVRMMRQTIRSGRLGRIFHIYIRCIKDSGLWENRPLEWRFDERYSASVCPARAPFMQESFAGRIDSPSPRML